MESGMEFESQPTHITPEQFADTLKPVKAELRDVFYTVPQHSTHHTDIYTPEVYLGALVSEGLQGRYDKSKGMRKSGTTVFVEPNGALWALGATEDKRMLMHLWRLTSEDTARPASILADPTIDWKPELIRRIHHKNRPHRLAKAVAGVVLGAIGVAGAVMAPSLLSSAEKPPAAAISPNLVPTPTMTPKATPMETPKATMTPTPAPATSPVESVTPPPSPEPEPAIVPPTDITMTTWNIYYKNRKNIKATVTDLMKEVRDPDNPDKILRPASQIIVLQEATRAREKLAKIARDNNYGIYPGPDAKHLWKLQILWDKNRLSVVEKHAIIAPSDPGHKRIISWVIFKENKTGRIFAEVAMHAPHQVDSKGLPSKKKASVKAHGRYTQKLTNIVKDLQSKDIPVFLLGDGNVASEVDNEKCITKTFFCQRLGSLMVDMWLETNTRKADKVSTHGNSTRKIDYQFRSETDATRVDITLGSVYSKNQKPKGGAGGSDHKPVIATYRFSDGRLKQEALPLPINLDGVNNERDVAASSGGLIKSGLVYRSAKLEDATSKDRAELAAILRNGFIVDLRTTKVRAKDPDKPVKGVADLNLPVDSASSAKTYVKEFVNDASNRKEFGEAIAKIAEARGSVLIHCTAGKDRTGWLVAMIMYSLGANDKQVMAEYMKSEELGANVDEAWLNAGLKEAVKKYGSVQNYIKKGLGVSDGTIAKLQARLKA